MSSDFKFITDSGRIVYVCAENRKAAVKAFCIDQGVTEEFVKEHCVVKNMGRIYYGKHS